MSFAANVTVIGKAIGFRQKCIIHMKQTISELFLLNKMTRLFCIFQVDTTAH